MDIAAEIELRRNELRRIAYNHYLRTGRVPIEIKSALGEDISGGYWVKFNPYHDPDNGRFTFAPGHPGAIGNPVVSDQRNAAKPHAPTPPSGSSHKPKPIRVSPKGRALITGSEGFEPRVYHPSPASGVTIGYGYDLKSRKKELVVRDLMRVGVTEKDAKLIAQGVGKTGTAATAFVKDPNVTRLRLTEKQANQMFEHDIQEYENVVRRFVRVPLTQNQFDALTSLASNLGGPNFAKSDVVRALNRGSYEEAARNFLHYTRSGKTVMRGLWIRRKQEVELFLTR